MSTTKLQKVNPPKVPHRDMANRLRTLSRSTIDMDILMIRKRNLYGIFVQMIHHLLWMSRHQKRGDLRADLQRAVGGKDLNGRKSFPRSDPQNEQYYPLELLRSQDKFD
jgi:hypothetical protein